MVELTGTEQADPAKFAVVSGVLDDLAPAYPPNRLGKRRSADTGQIVRGHLLEDGEFWPERGDKPVHDRVNALAPRPHGEDLANNFRKRNEIIEVRGTLGGEAIRAVREFSDPVQDPDMSGL